MSVCFVIRTHSLSCIPHEIIRKYSKYWLDDNNNEGKLSISAKFVGVVKELQGRACSSFSSASLNNTGHYSTIRANNQIFWPPMAGKMEWDVDIHLLEEIIATQTGLRLDIIVHTSKNSQRIGCVIIDLKYDAKVPKRYKKIYGMPGAEIEVSSYVYKSSIPKVSNIDLHLDSNDATSIIKNENSDKMAVVPLQSSASTRSNSKKSVTKATDKLWGKKWTESQVFTLQDIIRQKTAELSRSQEDVARLEVKLRNELTELSQQKAQLRSYSMQEQAKLAMQKAEFDMRVGRDAEVRKEWRQKSQKKIQELFDAEQRALAIEVKLDRGYHDLHEEKSYFIRKKSILQEALSKEVKQLAIMKSRLMRDSKDTEYRVDEHTKILEMRVHDMQIALDEADNRAHLAAEEANEAKRLLQEVWENNPNDETKTALDSERKYREQAEWEGRHFQEQVDHNRRHGQRARARPGVLHDAWCEPSAAQAVATAGSVRVPRGQRYWENNPNDELKTAIVLLEETKAEVDSERKRRERAEWERRHFQEQAQRLAQILNSTAASRQHIEDLEHRLFA